MHIIYICNRIISEAGAKNKCNWPLCAHHKKPMICFHTIGFLFKMLLCYFGDSFNLSMNILNILFSCSPERSIALIASIKAYIGEFCCFL